MFLHFAYLEVLYFLIPAFALLLMWRLFFYRSPFLKFSLADAAAQGGYSIKSMYKIVLWMIRFFVLAGLGFLMLRPQWADKRSVVNVEGVDIILAIDVSESMLAFDDPSDQRSRIDVAKSEGIRFVEKRIDDHIGVVIFGKEALSRCPLTLDKNILKEIVASLDIGIIDANGTWLGTGLATAINRLRTSKAKSKIVILLTDGQPTPPEKVEPEIAIHLAQTFGIKVYTIGVGSLQGGFINHPIMGPVQVTTGINEELLKQIASKTGGMYFRAKNPADMRKIYDTIDNLEKTKQQTNMFHHYYEAFMSLIWLIVCAFVLELLLRLFIWKRIVL